MKQYRNENGVKVDQKVNTHIHDIYENDPGRSLNTVNVKIDTGVLGNKKGEIKTSGLGKQSNKGISVGSSLMVGLKSSFVTGKWTVPFDMEWLEEHISEIIPVVASIQNKLSGIVREAQGDVSTAMKKRLRDTAIRSEAIQIAKEQISSKTNQQFDQEVFDGANEAIRAKVLTDMSFHAMVEVNFSISVEDDAKADWARQKGYTVSEDGDFMVMHAKEKGLKKVYLYSASSVSAAQDKVDEICQKIESKLPDIKKFQTMGRDESLSVLKIIDDALDYKPSTIDDVLFEDFTDAERETISGYVKTIIDNYYAIAESL